MVTSSTAKPTRLARGMVTFEDGCAVCCNGGGMAGAKGSERPIIAGPTNGLPTVGCCPWRQNTSGRAQSYHYETTDWRAGCGRSASPVRREGQGSIPCPYPYRPFALHESVLRTSGLQHFIMLALLASTSLYGTVSVSPEEMGEASQWAAAKFQGVMVSEPPAAGLRVLANNDPVQLNARGGRPLKIAD